MNEDYSQYALERLVKKKIIDAIRKKNQELLKSIGETSQSTPGDTELSGPVLSNTINIDSDLKFNPVRTENFDSFFHLFSKLNLEINTVLQLFRRSVGKDDDGDKIDIVELTTMQNFASLLKTNAEIDNTIFQLENTIESYTNNNFSISKSSKDKIRKLLEYLLKSIKQIENLFDFKDDKSNKVQIITKNPNYNQAKPTKGPPKTLKVNVNALSSNVNLINLIADDNLRKNTELSINEAVYNLTVRCYMFYNEVNNYLESLSDLKILDQKVYDNQFRIIEQNDPVAPDIDSYIQPIQKISIYKNMKYPELKYLPEDEEVLKGVIESLKKYQIDILTIDQNLDDKLVVLGGNKKTKDYEITHLEKLKQYLEDIGTTTDGLKKYIENIPFDRPLKLSEQNHINSAMSVYYYNFASYLLDYYNELLKIDPKGDKAFLKIQREITQQKNIVDSYMEFLDEIEKDEKKKEAENVSSGNGIRERYIQQYRNRRGMYGKGFNYQKYDSLDSRLPSKYL